MASIPCLWLALLCFMGSGLHADANPGTADPNAKAAQASALSTAPSVAAGQTASAEGDEASAAFDFFKQENQVVTATTFQQTIKETPASVTVITAEDIARYGYRTVTEILQGVTGFYSNSDGNYEYLGVRGMNILGDYSTRVLILVDGNTTNDPIYGSGYVGNELGVDVDAIKRIEIVLGPGSALYGTHAMFAVVNIITKNGEDVRGGSVGVGYGSWDSKEWKAGYGQKLDNGVDFNLEGSGVLTNGPNYYFPVYADPSTNNGWENGAAYEDAYKVLAKLSWSGLSLEGGFNWRLSGVPNDSEDSQYFLPIFNNNQSNTVDQGSFAEARYKLSLSPTLDVSFKADFRHYNWTGQYYGAVLQGDGVTLDTNEYVDYADSDSVGAAAQVDWQPFDGDWLTGGLETVNDYRLQTGNLTLDLDNGGNDIPAVESLNDLKVSSAFAQDIYKPVDAVTLILGGRYDYYSSTGGTFNPRVGLLYSFLDDNTIKLLYGRAFNAPTDYNLVTDQGLASVSPEALATWEAVYELEVAPVTLSLSGFQTTVSGLITGTYINSGLNYVYLNQGNAQTRGVDLNVKGEWRGIRARLGGEYQDTQDTGTDQDLVNSPHDTGHAELSVPVLGSSRRTFLSMEEVWVGFRELSPGVYLDPYLRSDLVLYSSGLIPHLDLTFKVANLFDQVYDDPISQGYAESSIGAPRRNFYGKATLTF